MILKAVVCLAVRSFGAMLLIVNLFIKTDSTVIFVPCMHEYVCYEPFSFKNCKVLPFNEFWFT